MNDKSIESLRTPMIFFANAKNWENAGEFDFEIDTLPLQDDEYKAFLKRNLDNWFSLKLEDEGYNDFLKLRLEKLKKNNREDLFGMAGEYSFLLDILFYERNTIEGRKERQSEIKNTFFKKTGICCFTLDDKSYEKEMFWKTFASYGNGFCIDYDFEALKNYLFNFNDYILKNDVIISKGPINYTNKKIKLKTPDFDSKKTMENYFEILYSLKQVLDDEKEYRFLMIYREDIPEGDNKRKLSIPMNLIKSVTIGCNVNPNDSDLIQKITSQELKCNDIFKMTNQHGYLYRRKI